MVFSAVFVANFYNGLNTSVWTGWVFFAIALGIVLLWLFTVRVFSCCCTHFLTHSNQVVYNAISPGWFVTLVYGNNTFLFRSALFWLAMPITVCVALLPRYIAKAWKFGFAPDDIDILRWIRKVDPHRDLRNSAYLEDDGVGLKAMRRQPTEHDDALSLRSSFAAGSIRHQHGPSASRTDMSTGVRSVHRGFDFATEEGGVAMQRMQTNLSSRRNLAQSGESHTQEERKSKSLKKSGEHHHGFSIRKNLLKRRPPSS